MSVLRALIYNDSKESKSITFRSFDLLMLSGLCITIGSTPPTQLISTCWVSFVLGCNPSSFLRMDVCLFTCITAQALQFRISICCDFMFSEVCTSLLCIVVVMVCLFNTFRVGPLLSASLPIFDLAPCHCCSQWPSFATTLMQGRHIWRTANHGRHSVTDAQWAITSRWWDLAGHGDGGWRTWNVWRSGWPQEG